MDAYLLVRCIRDGRVETLPGPLRVGAVWGIDDKAPNARRRTPERGRIRDRSLTALAGSAFDVLLSHDGPRDAVLAGSGSEGLGALIGLARPAFAFFGHYGSRYGRVGATTGGTQVYHLAGFEMRRGGSCAEEGSRRAVDLGGRVGDLRVPGRGLAAGLHPPQLAAPGGLTGR